MISDKPITSDDQNIRKALAQADLVVLSTVLLQLTGDERLKGLERVALPPSGGFLPTVSIHQDWHPIIREMAFNLLTSYRDQKRTAPPPPPSDQLDVLMDFCAGRNLSSIEHEMGREELALDDLPRRINWRSELAPSACQDFKVLVAGAGLGGIAAGVHLRRMGIPFTIVEKNPGFGGTWWRNTYPDARVDVSSHFYSFSFEHDYPWQHYFAPQAEIQQYFEYCAAKYDLPEHTRFNTQLVSARWNDRDGMWDAALKSTDGVETPFRANAIISAVGLFNRPNIPSFDGAENFRGTMFHTAEWDHGYDHKGKRVGIIGTGPSTMQLVPGIVSDVAQLTIFQRTAGWVLPVPHYRDKISDEVHWLMNYVPYYSNWYRFLQCHTYCDETVELHRIDPHWTMPGSISAANERQRSMLIEYMKNKVGQRPDLVEKCIPNYPAFSKRPIVDNGWFDSLLRHNVDLVTQPVVRFTPQGILTEDGVERAFDLLVIGTGYKTNEFLWPMTIQGLDGITLEQAWKRDGARAYLGITIPKFPNLFCLYGPNTNPKAGGIFFFEEMQVRYALSCIREIIEHGKKSISCRQETCDDYNQRMDKELQHLSWMHPSQKSYYVNAFGRVDVNMPWMPGTYYNWTRSVNLEDFVVS